VQGKKSVWVYFWHRHPITQLLWAEQIKSDAIRGVRRRSVVLTVFLLSLIYFSILQATDTYLFFCSLNAPLNALPVAQASFDRSSIKEDWEDVTNGRGSPHFVMTCFCAVLLFIFNRLLAAIYACTDKNGSCPMCHIPFKIFSMFIALLAIAVLLIMSAQTAGGGYIGYNCTFAEDYIEGLDDPGVVCFALSLVVCSGGMRDFECSCFFCFAMARVLYVYRHRKLLRRLDFRLFFVPCDFQSPPHRHQLLHLQLHGKTRLDGAKGTQGVGIASVHNKTEDFE
jgi:hypothetical protein